MGSDVPMASSRRMNCCYCGRFVSRVDENLIYDGYMGDWEADPMCGLGRGCQRQEADRG